MSLIIPAGFNELSRLEQIQHYQEAGLILHPCYGPLEQCHYPGKQPRWTIADRLAATPQDVLNHFRNHPTDNIGMVPANGDISIDLDAKNRGDTRSLEAYRVLYPKLFEHPYVLCDRGYHISLHASGVPPDQKKIDVPDYLPGLNLEIHVGIGAPANVIMPPSVHASGHIYTWQGEGKIIAVDFCSLLERFGVQGKSPSKEQQPRDNTWKTRFKGDLRTLNIGRLTKYLGIYGRGLDFERGEGGPCSIKCPWINEHTGGDQWSKDDSSTALFDGGDHVPGFRCLHSHCANRTIQDFLEWCEEQERGVVDQFCRKSFSNGNTCESEPAGKYTRKEWGRWDAAPEEFEHKIFYPENSILHPFMAYGRKQTEGNDAYLLGSIMAACSALLARRVHIDFGGPLYPNLFTIIGGKPGDRKSFTINLAERIVRLLLPPERFLAHTLSVEGLYSEYSETDGGSPDKICIIDDAAALLSTWKLSSYGERVADRMLTLYDCKSLSESFRRNKKESSKNVKRSIQETSTVLLFGATFVDALFSSQKAQQGLARRFLYYIACSPGRFIEWPSPEAIIPIANLFKPLLAFKGPLVLGDDGAKDLWRSFQLRNRDRLVKVPDNRPDLAHALSSEPTHVLKVAAIFELTTAAQRGVKQVGNIGVAALECAIAHVAENLRAAGYLFQRAHQLDAQQQGEEILARIRAQFDPDPKYPDTIFVSRTDLTATFCHHTSRRGSLTTEDLYLQILPELIRQGQAQLCFKKGKFEVYGFRVSDLDDDGGGIGPTEPKSGDPITPEPPNSDAGVFDGEAANSTFSTNSTPPLTTTETDLNVPSSYVHHMHICAGKEYMDERGGVENVEFVENTEQQRQSPDRGVDTHASGFLALDLETCAESPRNALNPWKGDIRLLTLADDAGNVQLYDLHTDQLPSAIRDVINRDPIIAHNAVFDLLFLTVKLGINPSEVFDTLTASRLITPSRKVEHGLGTILERYLGLKLPKELGASDWGGMLLTPDQLEYARNDVLHLHQLKAVLETEIEKAGLAQVFKLETDLIPVVVGMEQTGFAVDKALLQSLRAQAEKRQRDLGAVLREKFGLPTLNPDSPAQLLEAFRSIGVVLPDTNEATLKGVEHDIVPQVLEYRGASKFVGTTTGLLKHILPDDGRIHARFNSLGTDTGRFSSSKPNLQNITRGELRKVFVPSGPDQRLIVADYSQIELQIAALIAGDDVMLAAFRNREDLHRKTAAAILSKALGDVTKGDRQLAKSANFGLLYGMAADGFQAYTKNEYGLTLTLDQATEIRSRFFDQYQGLRRWHQDAWRQADSVTEARTIIGRRLLPNADTSWARFGLLTNYRVQGSAADLIKVAMAKLAGVLPSDARLVATVHDELILDVPAADAIQLCGIAQYAMQDAFKELFGETIPVEVDAKVCANWSEK